MFVPPARSSPTESAISSANEVIISDSLILQASRALGGGSMGVGGLLDLAALVEAVILHDHLLYLGDISHSVFNSLPLGRLLINEGIVRGSSPEVTTTEVQDSVYRLFGIPDAYEKMNLSPIIARQDTNSVLPYYGDYDYFAPDEVGMMLAELELAGKLPPFSRQEAGVEQLADSLPYYCFSLVEMWAGDNVWARRPAQAFLVRTLVYWVISDLLRISFYPDFTRLAIVAQITHQLKQSQGQGTLDQVAKAFYLPREELAWTNSAFEVSIPPLTRLVLERANGVEQLGPSLLELRQEYPELRNAMRCYQQAIRSSETLNELQQGRECLVSAGAEAAEIFEQTERVRILETTSYHQQELKIGHLPRDPAATSQALMFQPVEWVRAWWLQRNAIHILAAESKLAQIEDYGRLVKERLGMEFDVEQMGVFEQVVELMQMMYFKMEEAYQENKKPG